MQNYIYIEYIRVSKDPDKVFNVWLDNMMVKWMADGSICRVIGADAAP